MKITDYSKFTAPELLEALGDNAQKWAQAFMQLSAGKEIDEGLMIGWFANAIEHSSDIRKICNCATKEYHNSNNPDILISG